MPYRLLISDHFRRDLRRLDSDVHKRILEALEELATDPFKGSKLRGTRVGRRRMRIGDWRIRYDIEGNDVLLYRVRHRRDVYRG